MRKADRQYALYKGDEFIADGTPREIARKTGKTFDSLMFYTTPAYRRRVEKAKGPVLEMVDLEENDER
ncbi:hypothetical protein LK472_06485 [Leuconostoc lactis]|uniref:hypothetical protein n=1 Tax=Leuconostoc lactis TaxID=1246 RepID=UPI001D10A26B|nr:hypothetical protein [Leuconostoc lactis]MCC2745054.1 hypothetical protein [Leuconostoc lactis]MCC2755591.1 hypothetical protein [Leuconostoc lactis]